MWPRKDGRPTVPVKGIRGLWPSFTTLAKTNSWPWVSSCEGKFILCLMSFEFVVISLHIIQTSETKDPSTLRINVSSCLRTEYVPIKRNIGLTGDIPVVYSLTIYMLHYDPQRVSSSTLLILRRTNCITTASGIVTTVQYAGWERTAVRSQPAYCMAVYREWRYQTL